MDNFTALNLNTSTLNSRTKIEELVKSQYLAQYCKKITRGNDLHQDLHSHIILLLYELPEETYIAIDNIQTYAGAMAYREFHVRGSRFNQQLGIVETEELNGDYLIPDTTDIEKAVQENIENDYAIALQVLEKDKSKQIANNKFPVDHAIFEAYQNFGTIRKVADHFDIPKSTVGRIVKTFKTKIHETVNQRRIQQAPGIPGCYGAC